MALHHELAWWAAVGIVAVVSVLLFRIIAARIPFAPVQQLAAAL